MTGDTSDRRDAPTIADAALSLLLLRRVPGGGLSPENCEAMEKLLGGAADEAALLAKAALAFRETLGMVKAALLRCRAPEGEPEAADGRTRALGMIEDLAQGLADTEAQRLRMLAEAAVVLRGAPQEPKPSGALPFRPKKGG